MKRSLHGVRAAFLLAGIAVAAPALSAAEAPLRFAQATRDELFGIEKPAKPAPDATGPRIGGFVEGLVAYNYADPSHWSRAVARLQVVGQGELADNVKWRLGARVDADLVYFTSHFYRDDVKDDQRFDFFFRENYLDFTAGGWDFRVGAQQIVWGEVVGLFFADVVSARDMREFLLPGFDVIRIPQWAFRAEHFRGDSHVELVWIPVPVFDRIGKPGADFYPAPLPSPLPDEIAERFRDPERPARTLANSNYGIRANTLVSGFDLSAFYYRSFSTRPTFYREATGDLARPFVFQPRHDRIWQVGGTVSKDAGDFVVRGEVVYTHGQGHSVGDLASVQDVAKRSTLDWIVAVDWPLPRDSRVNVQLFQRAYRGRDDDLVVHDAGLGASLLVTTKLAHGLEPQLLYIQYFSDGGGMIRPRLNWTPVQNLVVGFGVDIFTGGASGFFGRYNNRDRVYTEARYSF